MKIKLNEAMSQESTAVQFTQVEAARAKNLAWNTKCAADKALAAYMPTIGLGRDALVRHVHSAANHGNQSDKPVVSRVVNVHFDDLGRVGLRIQLGTGKGPLSTQYANLLTESVDEVVHPSTAAFQY